MAYKPVEIKGRHLVEADTLDDQRDIAVEAWVKFVIVVKPSVP